MTVAVLGNYRSVDANGILDIKGTVETLKKAERLLDNITEVNS